MSMPRRTPYGRHVDYGSHKRRHSSYSDLSLHADASGFSSKKQKLSHPDFPPTTYWENLSKYPHSKLHLTKGALQALDDIEDPCPAKSSLTRPRRSERLAIWRPLDPRTEQAQEFLRRSTPTYLEKVKRFASHGGPDLRDLRGYPFTGPKYNMSSRDSSLGRRKRGSQSPVKRSGAPNTATTKSTGPYDTNFQQHLINHEIYPPRYTYPNGSGPRQPDNMDEIKRTLGQPRPSLSPSQFSDGAFDSFQDADTHAAKEAQVMARVIPIIEGKLEDPKCTAGQIPFNNLDHLTDGSLVAGNPDIYYGARPEQLQQKVRKQLSGKIEPSTQDHLPVAPNFFLHVKGPDGSLSVASRQACYDGALGARGVHCLQSYGQAESQYDNNAYTLTSIYHGGQLKMYTTHPIPPSAPGNKNGFAMTQIKTWALTGDADTFRQGVAAYRNGRGWARRQRDDAISQANERQAIIEAGASLVDDSLGLSFTSGTSAAETIVTSQQTTKYPGSPVPLSNESETSADELSLDIRPPVKPSY
ncbi:hypothetical protein MAC_09836 [Metarhizium acridum CQMa 102]|uniref:Uncharacterized protein n=1 Tax=Metarhizium acridum (strain CQMa 102) TaxID=655827 RepID=E9EIY8_METAQ|nr:uncharacterized protein MAC_09836 [Metarhizium acridum CQMa 102]EFY84121.1 hypothetical protein MAC_09836 [Metarhizium acridum CQMa 102]